MKIKIIAVGKIKENYFKDAIDEYTKRIKGYSEIEIIEVADEKNPLNASIKEEEYIRTKEGERILSKIKDKEYVITLDVLSKEMSSEEFAKNIENLMITGNSTIVFVIGGSLGISKEVKQRSNKLISFSKMTFPHKLARVILVEQIYRAFKIIKGETYHK